MAEIREELYEYLREQLHGLDPNRLQDGFFTTMRDPDGNAYQTGVPFIVPVRLPGQVMPEAMAVNADLMVIANKDQMPPELVIRLGYSLPDEEKYAYPSMTEDISPVARPFREVLREMARQAGLRSSPFHDRQWNAMSHTPPGEHEALLEEGVFAMHRANPDLPGTIEGGVCQLRCRMEEWPKLQEAVYELAAGKVRDR